MSTHSRFLHDPFQDLADECQSSAAGTDELRLAQRAAVAVAVVPVLVLLALTLIIGDWLEADTGFAVVSACIAWLVFEMHRYQRAISRQEAAVPLDATGPHGASATEAAPPER